MKLRIACFVFSPFFPLSLSLSLSCSFYRRDVTSWILCAAWKWRMRLFPVGMENLLFVRAVGKRGWNCVTGFDSRQDLSSGLLLWILTPLSLFIIVETRGGLFAFHLFLKFSSCLFQISLFWNLCWISSLSNIGKMWKFHIFSFLNKSVKFVYIYYTMYIFRAYIKKNK